MSVQHWVLAASAVVVAGLAVGSGFAERARINRNDPDRIGWVPWRGVQVVSAFGLVLLLILSLKV